MSTGVGIIFLQKDKFDFYSPGLMKVIEFRFVPEIIRDLEVINSDLLESLIKLFISSNKIAPTELIIVLADNSCFIKDFVTAVPISNPKQVDGTQSSSPVVPSNEDSEKLQEDIKFFIDHVPFENVLSRNFPMGSGTKVLAINQDFYKAIKNAFEKVGFKISAVYPGLVFENSIGAKPVMDIIVVNTILKQADYLKENNLLKEDKTFKPVVEKEKQEEREFVVKDSENKPAKKSNKRLFIMIGIFAVLIVVLIIVYIGSQQPTP